MFLKVEIEISHSPQWVGLEGLHLGAEGLICSAVRRRIFRGKNIVRITCSKTEVIQLSGGITNSSTETIAQTCHKAGIYTTTK